MDGQFTPRGLTENSDAGRDSETEIEEPEMFDREKWLRLCRDGRTCIGISSLCQDGKHVLMLDYDGLDYDEVAEDVQRLQHAYRLPDAVLLETKNGYHAYIPAKFPYEKLCKIIEASECDSWFKDRECRENMKQVILRISERGSTPPPTYKAIIWSRWNGRHETSLAHWLFLRWLFNVPLPRPSKHDGSRHCLFFLYKTMRN
jgi:hypothetical protein